MRTLLMKSANGCGAGLLETLLSHLRVLFEIFYLSPYVF